MKFALVGPAYPWRGGIAQYTGALAQALQEAGHQVRVLSFRKQYPSLLFPGKTQEDPSSPVFSVATERILDPLRPSSWKEAAAALAEYSPRAVVFQWWHPFFAPAYGDVARRLKKAGGSRIFFLCHNLSPHERPRLPGWSRIEQLATGWAFRLADGFLAHSEPMAEQLRRRKGNPAVRRIYHPAYDFYAQWDSRPSSADPSGPLHLLFFGNIREYKGLEILLRALGKVRSELPFRLTVAGEFYLDPMPYRRLADELRIGQMIDWEDRYIPNPEVPEMFRAADLVVLPYLSATQSGVVPLAYQFELPVIASRVGGLSEVVLPGKTGYLVPPGDPDRLAQSLLDFYTCRRRESFRNHIRAFRKNLSWSQVIGSILELLEEQEERA